MYEIDRQQNTISRLKAPSFTELGIKERQHLQEWIAKDPSCLGEDLLILQKEFAGFDDTNERLDLLAIDKLGRLVIIENKLDDSGKDVTWQAIKYAAYCWTMTTADIVRAHQKHLDKSGGGDAVESISDFLGDLLAEQALNDVVLNEGGGQRIILVAANFRKEITSSILWLRENQVDVRCFRVTPYSHKDDLFLDVTQVIPMPEADDFLVKMAKKDLEKKRAQQSHTPTQKMLLEYWSRLLQEAQAKGITLFSGKSPGYTHWLGTGAGVSGINVTMVVTKDGLRSEIAIMRGDAQENKAVFDQLYKDKEAIEHVFGEPLDWDRMDNKVMSRISVSRQIDKTADWVDGAIRWHLESIQRLEKAFHEPLRTVGQQIKASEMGGIKERDAEMVDDLAIKTIDRFIEEFGNMLEQYNVNQRSTTEDLIKFIMHANNMGGMDGQKELESYLEMAENHLDELKERLSSRDTSSG